MAGFVDVAALSSLPVGAMRPVETAGAEILLARVGDEVLAASDVCTHRRCYLSDGDLEGDRVVCPCHLDTFDLRTGEVLDGPPPAPIRVFPVNVDDGRVRVAVGPG